MTKKRKDIGFAIQGIKTEQFAILTENYSESEKPSMTTGLNFTLNFEKEIIIAFVTVEFHHEKNVFIKLVLSAHFNIEKTSWEEFSVEGKAKIIIPKELLAHLSAITASTARGVIFAKLEGTPFSKYLMPLVNVANMIKEDAVFEINDK